MQERLRVHHAPGPAAGYAQPHVVVSVALQEGQHPAWLKAAQQGHRLIAQPATQAQLQGGPGGL